MILILQVFWLIKLYKYYGSTLNNIVPVIIYKHIVIDYNKMKKITSANTLYLERIDKKLDIILNLLQKNQTNNMPITAVDNQFFKLFSYERIGSIKKCRRKI